MAQIPCFDELKALADSDPDAFERFRQHSCQEYIKCLPKPHQKRLLAIQFRVECEIARAKTPLAGVVKISSMMHDSFYQMRDKLNDLNQLVFSPHPGNHYSNHKVVDLKQWLWSKKQTNIASIHSSSDDQ